MKIRLLHQLFGKFRNLTICLIALVLIVLAQPLSSAQSGEQVAQGSPAQSRLDTVMRRGQLLCGIEGTIPSFSFVDSQGRISGLDVDICRAVSAAVFGDPDRIDFRLLDSVGRFPALREGVVDLLSRNSSWTASRDAAGGYGLEFAPSTFIDGQSLMVRKNSGISQIQDLQGKSVCAETATTNELNLMTAANSARVSLNLVKFQDSNGAFAGYAEGQCDAITSDRSQLAVRRITLPNPDEHMVWETLLNLDTLAPVTLDNDSRWSDVVRWVVYGLIQAEEYGITQANVSASLNNSNPIIQNFLGSKSNVGSLLGLTDDFMVKVIRSVGNYGEIYDRNLGSQSSIDLPRGANNLWNRGGLMYSPGWR
jgi:general L-amino acid transport system substrate-binding protein